jgi:thiosulfate/3-mercaptopyruvate sulfurtransferase
MKISPRLFAMPVLALSAKLAVAGMLPGPVVDTAWLAAHLDQVQVVDVRSNVKSFTAAPEFDTDAKTGKKTLSEAGGHIAGSRLMDMKTVRVERKVNGLTVKAMLPEKADWERIVRAAGVDGSKPIVLVPLGMAAEDVDEALRAYWQFKVYGEDDVAVLDGGMAAWLVDGHPASTDAAAAHAGDWNAKADRSAQMMALSEDVVAAQGTKGTNLVDARDIRQFNGLAKSAVVSAYGHIDGAHNYAPDLMFRPVGGAMRFMNPATYRGLLNAQGVDASAPAITYCNTGHFASGPWFMMSEVLGNKQVKLYAGSMQEWTLEKHPVAGAVPLN